MNAENSDANLKALIDELKKTRQENVDRKEDATRQLIENVIEEQKRNAKECEEKWKEYQPLKSKVDVLDNDILRIKEDIKENKAGIANNKVAIDTKLNELDKFNNDLNGKLTLGAGLFGIAVAIIVGLLEYYRK